MIESAWKYLFFSVSRDGSYEFTKDKEEVKLDDINWMGEENNPGRTPQPQRTTAKPLVVHRCSSGPCPTVHVVGERFHVFFVMFSTYFLPEPLTKRLESTSSLFRMPH